VLAGATVVAIVAIVLFPRTGGDSPPLASLSLIGAAIAAATTPVLYVIARRDLGLPARTAVPFVAAFALIALVKFVLAPEGLYSVNAIRPLEDALGGTVADPTGALLIAASVFGLYALGYRLVFWIATGEPVRDRWAGGRERRSRPDRQRRRLWWSGALAALAVAAGILVGGAFLLVAALVLFSLLSAPLKYLEFVFSSWTGIAILLGLLCAAFLLDRSFSRFEENAELVVEVGSIVTLFWLGLGFLALYHVLWIVYVLVLGSIWPLRTVVPK
jgi:hypothetical protein